jgi:hypothetical protein
MIRLHLKTFFSKLKTPVTALDKELKNIPQAQNRTQTWSKSQIPRSQVFAGPRFEQTDLSAQVRHLVVILAKSTCCY